MINNPRIEISIHVENDELLFDVRNRFNPIATEIKDKNSGIGLPNLRRRLDLLYRNSHVLTQNIKDEWYISSLSLKLK
jgi:two-component system LytT family sensor kinase